MELQKYHVNNKIDRSNVKDICSLYGIEVKRITSITGNFNREIFFINDRYILRSSDSGMIDEKQKLKRVESLECVPKIKHDGVIGLKTGKAYYMLLDMLPGDDFVHACPTLSGSQQKKLGQDAASFLDRLHSFCGTNYDIGLYIPAIPGYFGSWKSGHQKYWELLKQGIKTLSMDKKSMALFDDSFLFLDSLADSLSYQGGPRLLHNDFHPKNIIVNKGNFSGVIDWECSQFGESDFELTHVIHWCLYPPHPAIDFRTFLGSLCASSHISSKVPSIEKRLTIYQIEHEIQQIIWSNGKAGEMRIPRIKKWMNNAVEKLLHDIG